MNYHQLIVIIRYIIIMIIIYFISIMIIIYISIMIIIYINIMIIKSELQKDELPNSQLITRNNIIA